MNFASLLLVAMGVSADAFAVALAQGLAMSKLRVAFGMIIAAVFTGFQLVMPLLGYALADLVNESVNDYATIIAAILLASVGIHMVLGALRGAEGGSEAAVNGVIRMRRLITLGIAVSIDSFAVGISFALLGANLAVALALIAVATFALTFLGVYLGHKMGVRYCKPAEIAGGLVLVALAVMFLLN